MAKRDDGRKCGECTACCKPFSIPEVDKHDGSWCKHSMKGRGCAIYNNRPFACREFKCLWLYGYDKAENRPDKIGFFVATGKPVTLHDIEIPHFAFYETKPGALDTARAREFIGLNVDEMHIVTVVRIKDETTYSRTTRFSHKYSAADARLIEEAINDK